LLRSHIDFPLGAPLEEFAAQLGATADRLMNGLGDEEKYERIK
jgi:hypothetical protein